MPLLTSVTETWQVCLVRSPQRSRRRGAAKKSFGRLIIGLGTDFPHLSEKRGSEDPNRAHEGQLGSVRKPSSLDRDLGRSVSDHSNRFFRKSESPICPSHVFKMLSRGLNYWIEMTRTITNQLKSATLKLIAIQQANKWSTLTWIKTKRQHLI